MVNSSESPGGKFLKSSHGLSCLGKNCTGAGHMYGGLVGEFG